MSILGGPDIVESGLVLYLDAANPRSYPGSGTAWNDMSGNGNTGTLTNGPAFSTGNNGSISFDGVNDYVALSLPTQLSEFTISTWINIISYPGDERQIFSAAGDSIGFTILGGKFFVWNGSLNYGTQTIITNKWYNCVSTRVGSSTQIIVNGEVDGNFSTGGNMNSGAARIAGYSGGRYLNTNISSFSIYNRALSATEILQNYNATRSRFGL